MVRGGSWREKGFSMEEGGRGYSAEAARFWLSGQLCNKWWPHLSESRTQDDSSKDGHLSLMK